MPKTLVPLTAYPSIAAEWHPTLNGDLLPKSVSDFSRKVAWWCCANDASHVFRMSVVKRLSSYCPYCVVDPDSLLGAFPEAAKLFHPTLNGDAEPSLISAKSGKKMWWQCDVVAEHVWQKSVQMYVRLKNSCPFCKGARVSSDNSLAKQNPEIALQWHPVKNLPLTADEVTNRYNNKVWWQCDEGHEWQSIVRVRIDKETDCPFCVKRWLLKEDSLGVKFPEIAAEWHPSKNEKISSAKGIGSWKDGRHFGLAPEDRPVNRRLDPFDVFCGSSQLIWWQCSKKKDHVFRQTPKHRTAGHGCPYCANQKVDNENNLQARFPAVAKHWHLSRNKPVRPSDVLAGTDKVFWWRCHRGADHVWSASVYNMVQIWKRGNNCCPYCKGRV